MTRSRGCTARVLSALVAIVLVTAHGAAAARQSAPDTPPPALPGDARRPVPPPRQPPTLPLPRGPLPVVAAADAGRHLGQTVIVEGAVAQISRAPEAGLTTIHFGGEFPRQTFSVLVPARLQGRLDGRIWTARRLRVRGEIRKGATGVPEIECADPSQIAVVVDPD